MKSSELARESGAAAIPRVGATVGAIVSFFGGDTQNKALLYNLLFRTASETMMTIAADSRHLGARIGITSVLHTPGSSPGAGSGDRR